MRAFLLGMLPQYVEIAFVGFGCCGVFDDDAFWLVCPDHDTYLVAINVGDCRTFRDAL
jgi:hypothetical protein